MIQRPRASFSRQFAGVDFPASRSVPPRARDESARAPPGRQPIRPSRSAARAITRSRVRGDLTLPVLPAKRRIISYAYGGIDIVTVHGDRLGLIQTVDDFAGVHRIVGGRIESIGERFAGEQALCHAEEHDIRGVVEFKRQLGVIDEVDSQQIRHRLIVTLPGQLDESSTIIDFPVVGSGLP